MNAELSEGRADLLSRLDRRCETGSRAPLWASAVNVCAAVRHPSLNEDLAARLVTDQHVEVVNREVASGALERIEVNIHLHLNALQRREVALVDAAPNGHAVGDLADDAAEPDFVASERRCSDAEASIVRVGLSQLLDDSLVALGGRMVKLVDDEQVDLIERQVLDALRVADFVRSRR